MPNWGQVLKEIQTRQSQELTKSAHHQQSANPINCINAVKRDYLTKLYKHTGRNIIAYYSGWLSKPGIRGTELNDEDKNGFMMCVHDLDRNEGLDIILHTPGGGITSTQSIVDYLHKMFRADRNSVPNIRAIVPQIAMSAGTMIACSCKEIWMAKHSNLGPIDPQVNGWPAYGVLEEFEEACRQVKVSKHKISVWQSIIGQYPPALLGRCQNAIDLSNAFVRKQLANVMLKGQRNARQKAADIVRDLTKYRRNKTHDKHIHFEECEKIGLNVKLIEHAKDTMGREDPEFQDLILTVHHCYMHLLMNTPAYKVIENQKGAGFCKNQIVNAPMRPNQSQAGFESI
jgi:Serine dehydrogenase proteinase